MRLGLLISVSAHEQGQQGEVGGEKRGAHVARAFTEGEVESGCC